MSRRVTGIIATLRRSGLLLPLALLALFTRLVVPAGFMPSMAAGGPAFVLCSGDGAISLDNAAAPHQQPKGHEAPCGFGALGWAGLTTLDTIVPAAPFMAVATAVLPAGLRLGEGLGRPPQPSTGPPARS